MDTRTGGAVLFSDEGYCANRVGSLPPPEVAEFQQPGRQMRITREPGGEHGIATGPTGLSAQQQVGIRGAAT
jgi:hypothetical protein